MVDRPHYGGNFIGLGVELFWQLRVDRLNGQLTSDHCRAGVHKVLPQRCIYIAFLTLEILEKIYQQKRFQLHFFELKQEMLSVLILNLLFQCSDKEGQVDFLLTCLLVLR